MLGHGTGGHPHNPRYLHKLGIIQQQLTQVQNTQTDHEKTIIDGLCDAISAGQSVPDFIALLRRLYQDELAHIHDESRAPDEEDETQNLVNDGAARSVD